MNAHVTSHGYTFSQHMALAELWCRFNGQRGSEQQALNRMNQLSAPDLVRMLTERNVSIPAHLSAPVVSA